MNSSSPRIALIRPYYKEVLKQQSFPIGLGYLAAVLREKGFIAQIFDLNILQITNEEFISFLNRNRFDFIGITALSWYYKGMCELSNLIKSSEILSSIPLILGGVHVSSLPELSLIQTRADYVVIGEGEVTVCELLKSILNHTDPIEVKGIAFLKNNKYIQTPSREMIRTLDSIPVPAWDLLHPERYDINPHGTFYKKSPVYPIFTSRGCPFQCTYCSSKNFWRQQIRYHSIPRIVDEIEYLVTKYGAKEIHIWDDNFTLKRERVVEFCKEIQKRKLKLLFACPNGVKIDTLDRDLLWIMKKTGFYSLIFAIESGSQRILNVVKKNLDLTIVPSIIKTASQMRYFTRGFFIFGLPTETINDIYKTINFALTLPLDQANFFIFSPLPGCSFFYDWIKTKDIHSMDFSYDFFNNPQDMSGFNQVDQKSIFKLQRFYYIKFLLMNPRRLLNYFLRIKIEQIPRLFDRFIYMFTHK